jgi:hypothetical protein
MSWENQDQRQRLLDKLMREVYGEVATRPTEEIQQDLDKPA